MILQIHLRGLRAYMLMFQAPGDEVFRLKDCQSTCGGVSTYVGEHHLLVQGGRRCLVFLAVCTVAYRADDHFLLISARTGYR